MSKQTEKMNLALEALVDDEGENRAVRMFLALYGGQPGVTTRAMRLHLKMSGFDGAWPEWANREMHLTKAGAQLWIRYLFALEQPAQPQQEPVAFIDMQEWPPIRWRDGLLRGDVHPFDGQPLFFAAAPPPAQRKPWVGLTVDDIHEILRACNGKTDVLFVTQDKLRKKNA